MSPAVMPRAGAVDPTILSVWGKYDETTGAWHPAIWHMLDSWAVADALVDSGWAPQLLTDRLGPELLGPLTALHDIGKLSAEFTLQVGALIGQMAQHGLTTDGCTRESHERIGAVMVDAKLQAAGLPRPVASLWAVAVSVEHGRWISLQGARNELQELLEEDPAWEEVRGYAWELLWSLTRATPADLAAVRDVGTAVAAAGFIKVCDWIASNPAYFGYDIAATDPESYLNAARTRARKVVAELGLVRHDAPATVDAADLFDFVMRSGQRAVDEMITGQAPGLLIVEDATGSGKTEAAMLAASRWLAANTARGLYIGLPTQATARTMHARLKPWLERFYPGQDVVSALNIGDWHTAGPGVETEPHHWFRGPHRAMLAPIGVGTIDQLTAAALQGRFSMVRMGGIAGRVVVLDEVHAYDAFVGTHLRRALTWLGYLRCPVVLLSATLPATTRAELVDAYRLGAGLLSESSVEGVTEVATSVPWPSITLIAHCGEQLRAVPPADSHRVELEHRTDIPGAIRDHLGADQFGCVAVVVNSVAECITLYRKLHAEMSGADVLCFHSAFTRGDRARIESAVLAAAGKEGIAARRHRLTIVVATQVIEQSLDLDFDLMVTDWAPVDLVLQRIGRLHRWGSETFIRPGDTATPRLVIRPFDPARSWVYQDEAPATMHRTVAALQHRDHLTLPAQTPELVSAVYDSTGPVDLQSIEDEKARARTAAAALSLIPLPDKGRLQRVELLYAPTRDGRPSEEIVLCLPTGEPTNGSEDASIIRRPLDRAGHIKGVRKVNRDWRPPLGLLETASYDHGEGFSLKLSGR